MENSRSLACLRRASVLSLISATLALQFAASFRVTCLPAGIPAPGVLHTTCAPALWPFLDYPMYSGPHHAGDVLSRRRLIGALSDSTTVELGPADFALASRWLFNNLVAAIEHGQANSVEQYMDAYNSTHRLSLVSLTVEDEPLALTGAGFVPTRRVTHVTYPPIH